MPDLSRDRQPSAPQPSDGQPSDRRTDGPTDDGLLLSPADAALRDREAAGWRELALSAADLSAVELRLCLPDLDLGELVLPAPAGAEPGEQVALRDAEGVLIAGLRVSSVVDGRVTGEVHGVRLPAHPDAADLRRSPGMLTAELRRRGWTSVHAVLTDRPLFGADLERLRLLLDGRGPDGRGADGRGADGRGADGTGADGTDGQPGVDGVVVALLAGGVEPTDAEHHTRVAALRAGLSAFPADRVLLTLLPLSADAGPELRRAVAAGYGLARCDVDPAPGSPSSDAVRAVLESGAGADAEVGPAEVVDVLRRTHRPRAEQGFTLLFTGLSGSGKSTVAGLLAVRLMELTDRRVLLLDGDRVRRHLTAGLGFSKADRITNVRRIGWVAAQVSAAGGIAVCAPIAPYDSMRREMRAMVQGVSPAAGFVLVHIATPLEECERRDRKGLYAKARAGELPEFTGISDPYEVPTDAEVVADTTGREPGAVVDDVLAHLVEQGWLASTAGWIPAQ